MLTLIKNRKRIKLIKLIKLITLIEIVIVLEPQSTQLATKKVKK